MRKEIDFDEVVNNLSSTLPKFLKKIHRYANDVFGKINISEGQKGILHYLKHHGKAKMSEIGKELMISKPNLTVLVDKLYEAGIIARDYDETDRRVIYIYITEKGFREIEEYRKIMKENLKNRMEKMSDEEIEIIIEMAEVMNKFLNNKNI